MDSKRLMVLLALGALLIALAASQKPKAPSCDKVCPGGVCPAPYKALEAYYTSIAEPAVNIPLTWREKNYAGGSCVHATTETLLRWVGQPAMAEWWRQTYRGGENAYAHERKLQEAGLRYVMTTDGDVRLLEWALATRRGAGVGWPTRHCTALVGHEGGYAVIEDNNHPGTYTTKPWDQFVQEWQGMGGWAFVLVYTPPAPVPR